MDIENTKRDMDISNAIFGSFGGLMKHPSVVSFSSWHLHTGVGVASQSQIPFPEHMDGQNMLWNQS